MPQTLALARVPMHLIAFAISFMRDRSFKRIR